MARLYLITPTIADAAAFAPVFKDALAACDIACVLLRLEARDEGDRKKLVRALAPLAQERGAACLVCDDPQLALRTDCDGVHVEGDGETLGAALTSLHPRGIVGAGGLSTRDAAMTAGELGADYLMFGGPGSGEAHAALVERVAWWAEIFNVPCVGYAQSLGGVAELARAGADFVALGEAVFADPRGPATALGEAAAMLELRQEAAH